MTREKVLESALSAVTGTRAQDYGKAEDNFETIASLWSSYITLAMDKTVLFDAHDVAMMMVLFKAARVMSGRYHPDNYIDMAGYAALASEMASKEKTVKV